MPPTDSFERYLSILGVEAAPPSLGHLRRLVSAQLIRVPFENISKLYFRKTRGATFAPSLEEHLDGIEYHHFGGTCYANNPHFYSLLRHLGYAARLCGADMTNPDAHIVSMVAVDGREFLVDVGYAAPFFDPLPRDLARPHEVPFGASRYVLEPQDAEGRSRLRMFRSGREIHGYLAKPEPREINHFAGGIRESYRSTATFMNTLVVEKFFTCKSVRIHNLKVTESTPEHAETNQLADRDELAMVIERVTGISAAIVREAIAGVDLEGDIYS